MFDRMKLGAKIAGGFAVVLILTAIVAIVSFAGIKQINKIVRIADDANRLTKYALEARKHEKNFMIKREKEIADEMDSLMKNISSQIENTINKIDDPAEQKLLKDISLSGEAYKKNFDLWVKESDYQKREEESMVKKARLFEQECLEMRKAQKEKAETALILSKNISKYLKDHLKWAEGVRSFLMDKNQKIIPVEKDGTLCAFGEWLASAEFKNQIIVGGEAAEKIVENMKKDHMLLHESAEKIESARLKGAPTLPIFKKETEPLLKEILGYFDDLEKVTAEVYKNRQSNADAANRLIKLALETRIHEKNFMARGEKEYADKKENTIKKIYSECENLKDALKDGSEKRAVDHIKENAMDYKKSFDNWMFYYDKQADAASRMIDNAREFLSSCEYLRNDLKNKMFKVSSGSNLMVVLGGILAIILGSALAFVITIGITRPVNSIIVGLDDGAEHVTSAAIQVSSTSQTLAEGASEQAASIEETSSSLEEMASQTKMNASNSDEADSLMKEASRTVAEANRSMDTLMVSMSDITTASEETSKIIKTIDEIAFQTNLLALNAAVEAARAGEAGAGFAVVAEEVRSLALRAAEAAKNTSNLIEGTIKKVKDGAEITEKTNTAFTLVNESASRIGGLISEISGASKEQSKGIEQINLAVSQMDKVTQKNAANAEESASASEELSAQAEQMKSMVSDLSRLVRGASARSSNFSSVRPGARGNIDFRKKAHTIVKAGVRNNSVNNREVGPERIIPFDDNEDDFTDWK